MMLSFEESWLPDFDVERDEQLYLLVDGAQFENLAESLYQVSGVIDLEPLYLYGRYQGLLEVSPYVVKATESFQDWFITQNKPTAGFFFTSQRPLTELCDHLRQLIKVKSPYGSDVFFKIAHSEAAWVLLENDLPHLWAVMDKVWLPTRFGWHERQRPMEALGEPDWPMRFTDELWQQLQQIIWRNTLQDVLAHIALYFPHLLHRDDQDVWLDETAKYAYRQGFSTVQDLLFFFNVIGYLGEDAVYRDQYPDIYSLLTQASIQTPSQRVEQAAELAYQYRQSLTESQESNR